MAALLSSDGAPPRERLVAAAREGLRVPAALPPVSALLAGDDGTVWLKREDTGRWEVDWCGTTGPTTRADAA